MHVTLDVDIVFDDKLDVGNSNVWGESRLIKTEVNANETFSSLFPHVVRVFVEKFESESRSTPQSFTIKARFERGTYKGKTIDDKLRVSEVLSSGERIQVNIAFTAHRECCIVC